MHNLWLVAKGKLIRKKKSQELQLLVIGVEKEKDTATLWQNCNSQVTLICGC